MSHNVGLATPLLRPIVGLAGWTFVMEVWMYATRIPALNKTNPKLSPYDSKEQFNAHLPRPVQWIAENYNHLHEQPTVFYAVALALAIVGDDHPYTVEAAWAYAGVRVVHSLVQSITNTLMVRFSIFISSSFVLAGLTARLATLVF